jgi:hypothetical protein
MNGIETVACVLDWVEVKVDAAFWPAGGKEARGGGEKLSGEGAGRRVSFMARPRYHSIQHDELAG